MVLPLESIVRPSSSRINGIGFEDVGGAGTLLKDDSSPGLFIKLLFMRDCSYKPCTCIKKVEVYYT